MDLCGKCADLIVFIDACVIRSGPSETRSDRFLYGISRYGSSLNLLMPLCNYLPVNLDRILLEIAIFMPEMPFNSASVLIRFSKFFLGISQPRCLCMLIGLLPTPIPLLYIEICAKILNFMPKCCPVQSRSIPFNSGRSVLKLVCVK